MSGRARGWRRSLLIAAGLTAALILIFLVGFLTSDRPVPPDGPGGIVVVPGAGPVPDGGWFGSAGVIGWAW